MDGPQRTDVPHLETPTHLGRYRIIERLGSGSLGVVLKSRDDELRRDVAIKVPHPFWFATPQHTDAYLNVVRHVARLDHPGIVPVYDTGLTQDGVCYVVTKFMTSGSLVDRARAGRFSPARTVRLVMEVARTLHDAHRQDLVHRNVKPTNILMGDHQHPCVTDFGMPTVETAAPLEVAGESICWLAPEQLRGELHRIDARTDIHSLGLILYWLLTSSSSFAPGHAAGRALSAARSELPDLHGILPALPAELARVCHRAAARRMSDRYTTALDFGDDLEGCLALLSDSVERVESSAEDEVSRTPHAGSRLGSLSPSHAEPLNCSRVVPKGLRSFDREDAEFFLELVPGPRGRDGLPESVRFWKQHLEQMDPDLTFSVGLIYGPSGCGKSSLVKAGLIPRLDAHVIPIYLESTPDGTERRILSVLRRHFPMLSSELSLVDTLAEIRRGHGLPTDVKVVLILDQFEQWLHANRERENPELIRALRHCDGRRLQSVVMARDDFWMAVTRFMHKLEIRLVEGKNSAAIDLFSPQHARKVLIAFGRAYGCLSDHESEFSTAELEFLAEAIEGLASDGRVISVQLALFAEMVKNRQWTPAALRDVGGTAGIGIAFLEETFTGPHAPPEHRRHQRAARAVLKQLLPEQGTDIKGRMQPRDQLLAISGYASQPREFEELLHLLDHELRLVTPADPEDADENTLELSSDPERAATTYYQLTHDFLVPSIRRWLVHKQQETKRGRAELALAETAAAWAQRPEKRFLPSLGRWLRIRMLTAQRDWNRSEQSLMRAAARYYAVRVAVAVVIAVTASWSGYEGLQYVRAQALRDRLLFVATSEVPAVVAELGPYQRWARRLLREVIAQRAVGSRETLHARLGLLPDDASQVEPLFAQALEANDAAYPVLVDALFAYRHQLIDPLWQVLANENAVPGRRLRAAMMLARFDPPQDEASKHRWSQNAVYVAQSMLAATITDPTRFHALIEPFAPVATVLVDRLQSLARDTERSEAERSIASNLFIHFASDRPDLLVQTLLEGGAVERQGMIIGKLVAHRNQAIRLLAPVLQGQATEPADRVAERPAAAQSVPPSVVEQMTAADGMVADSCAFCQTLLFTDLSKVAEPLQSAGYRPVRIRPYWDRDVLRVAAGWVRDEYQGQFELDVTPDQLLAKSMESGPAQLLDIAQYRTPEGRLARAAVWSTSANPESSHYVGNDSAEYRRIQQVNAELGMHVVSVDYFPLEEEAKYAVSAVFWKQPSEVRALQTQSRYEQGVSHDFAGRQQASIDLTAIPTRTYHELERAFRLKELSDRADTLRSDPESFEALYHSAWVHLRLGNDQEAIEYFTRYLQHHDRNPNAGYRRSNSYQMRALAAMRSGDARAEEFYRLAVTSVPLDDYAEALWRTLGGISNGSKTPEDFESIMSPRFAIGHVLRDTAIVFAWAASTAKNKGDEETAERYTVRAIEYVRRAFQAGDYASWLFNEIWFNDILDDPRIQRLQWETEIANLPAVSLARQGASDGARAELARYLAGTDGASEKMRAESAVLTYLGDDETAARKIEATIADVPATNHVRYWGACASYSLMAELLSSSHPERSQLYFQRAMQLLRERVTESAGLQQVAFRREVAATSGWFFPLRRFPGFQDFLNSISVHYSNTFAPLPDIETREFHGSSPQEHLEQCRKLVAAGWKLSALDVCVPAGADAPTTASVWQRARNNEVQRAERARRIASAGVALLRLGEPELVWPLLQDTSDPEVRTMVLMLLGPAGLDPETVVTGLLTSERPGIRRALLLALGSYPAHQFADQRRAEILRNVRDLLRHDHDPGVHSACQWFFRRWQETESLASVEAEIQSADAPASRPWQVNSLGQTFVRITGPLDFDMGTRPGEALGDPDEVIHRRRIPRSYEIATTEVTWEQYQRFLEAHPELEHPLRDRSVSVPGRPVTNVTFYDVAKFCRWLSEQEGIPESEMVYPPIEEIGPKMLLRAYPLSRSGYRLPTEPEWEYACRAGTTTPRYFGYSSDFISQFAWVQEIANNRLWPVGQLWPNDIGLFDMYGNAAELCEAHVKYPRHGTSQVAEDERITQWLAPQLSLRGGSMANPTTTARSADRFDFQGTGYDKGLAHVGFRLVRTVLPAELVSIRRLRERAVAEGQTGERNAALLSQIRQDYEQLLTENPHHDDYAWEFSEFLIEEASAWIDVQESPQAPQQPVIEVRSDGTLVIVTRPLQGTIAALKLEIPQDRMAHFTRLFGVSTPELRLLNVEEAESSASLQLTRGFTSGIRTERDVEFQSERRSGGVDIATWALHPPVQSAEPVRWEIALRPRESATLSNRLRAFVSPSADAHKLEEWRFQLARSSLNGYARLACARMLRKEHDLARRALEQAGIDPTGTEQRDAFLLALLHRELNQMLEAEQWLTRGMAGQKDDTSDPSVIRLVADAMAIVTDARPTEPTGLARRARLLMPVDPDEAAAVYERAFQISGDSKLLIARAHLYTELGARERAAADFQQAAQLNATELDRFLQTGWWTIGPYPLGHVSENIDSFADPSQTQKSHAASEYQWQAVRPGALGDVNLWPFFSKDNIAIHALTYVYSPEERTVLFLAGADDRLRLQVNGQFAGEVSGFNMNLLDPALVVPIDLRAGQNVILASVENGIGEYRMHVRLGDHPLTQAQWLAGIGLWKEATPYLQRVLSQSQFSVQDRRTLEYQLGLLLAVTGDVQQYRQFCEQVAARAAISIGSSYEAVRLFLLAPDSIDPAQLATAISQLESLAGRPTENQFYDALAAYRVGNYSKALELVNENAAVTVLLKSRVLRAMILARLGQHDVAREQFDAAAAAYEVMMRQISESLGQQQIAIANWQDAAELIILLREARVEIAEAEPGSPFDDALAQSARKWRERADPRLLAYDQAVHLAPQNSQVWRARARKRTEMNLLAEAVADYLHVLSVRPGDQQSRRELFTLLPRLPDLLEAIELHASGSGYTSNQPEYWLLRGHAWLELGRDAEAVADFAKALDIYPDEVGWSTPPPLLELVALENVYAGLREARASAEYLRLARAHYLSRLRRWREAADEYEAIYQHAPRLDVPFEYAAVLILSEQRQKHADLLQWLRSRPESEQLSEQYVIARSASVRADSIHPWSDMVRLAENAAAENGNPWNRHVFALALFRAGRLIEAEEQAKLSMGTAGWGSVENALNELLLALIHAQRGELSHARQKLDSAKLHGPITTHSRAVSDWLEFRILCAEAEKSIITEQIRQLTTQLAQQNSDKTATLGQRAELYAELHHWSEAAADYAQLSAAPDQRIHAVRQQTLMYVQQQDWRRAADCLGQIVESDIAHDHYLDFLHLMAVLSIRKDRERHTALRQQALNKSAQVHDPFVSERVTKGSLIFPAPSEEASRFVELADRGIAADSQKVLLAWCYMCRSLAAYRNNDFQGALEWSLRSLELGQASPTWYRDLQAYVVEAMAHYRLGQEELARATLRQAERIYQEQFGRQQLAGHLLADWHDWILSTVLLGEARATLGMPAAEPTITTSP